MSSLPPPPPPGWQPPASGPSWGGPPPAIARPRATWSSLRGLSVALTVLLIASAVASLLAIATLIRFSQTADDNPPGLFGWSDEVQDAEDVSSAATGLVVVLGIAVFVLLVIWSYRAARDREALGRDGSTLGAGWAIGGWFIPLGNAVLPFLVLKDVWKSGDATVAPGDPAWRKVAIGTSLVLWWGLSVVAIVAWFVVFGATPEDGFSTADEVHDFVVASCVATVVGALLSLSAMVAIRAMTRRQHHTHDVQAGGYGAVDAGTSPWGSQPRP